MKRIGNFALALILTVGVGGGAFILNLYPSWADEVLGEDVPQHTDGEASSQTGEIPAVDESLGADEESDAKGEWHAPDDINDKGIPDEVAPTPAEPSEGSGDETTAIPVETPEATETSDEIADETIPADTDEAVSEGEWSADIAVPAPAVLPAPAQTPAPASAPTPQPALVEDEAGTPSAALSGAGSLPSEVLDGRTSASAASSEATSGALLDAPEFSTFDDPQPSEGSVVADFSVLDAALADTTATARGNYTQESWDVFKAAIANAQSIRSNAQATQAEVDGAVSALAAAKVGLALSGSASGAGVGTGVGTGTGGLPRTGDTALPLIGGAGVFVLLGTAALFARRVSRGTKTVT